MARKGKIGYKRKTKNNVRFVKKGSDESDEDYKVDEDEDFFKSEDDYCSSLAEDELEDNFEESWVKNNVKKVGRPSVRKSSSVRQRKKNSGAPQRKKNRLLRKEEDDADDSDAFPRQEEEDEFVDEHPRKKSRVSITEVYEDFYDIGSYQEDDENDSDEKFTPGEVMKRTRRGAVKRRAPRRKNKTITGWGWGRRRKTNVNSDSDFVWSGSSDYEYTISEEEREQVREATEYCRRLATTRTVKRIEEDEMLTSKRMRTGRKGKKKAIDLNSEVAKRVCGICLSEEGNGAVTGVLSCCNHYFCFACIMEWSKVESRCPLCKQRFITVSRIGRAGSLRAEVIPVPERDQVYQPSEEELRGYLDPYENVICTECQQGGDDALMLLCDLCDSPAHTYCVGLGCEIPDGNWYCDGCRPTALAPNPSHEHGASNILSSPVRVTFDLNEEYVPDTPSQSPRHHSQDSGPIASTLHARRRIHRHINLLLNNRSRQSDIDHFGSSPIGQHTTVTPQSVIYRDVDAPPSFYSQRIGNFSGEALQGRASTSGRTEFCGTSGTSHARADANTGPYQFREATVPSTTFGGTIQ